MAGRQSSTILAVAALVLCLVQWSWLSWRFSSRDRALREKIDFLTSEVARLQSEKLPDSVPPRSEEDDRRRLQGALERLGSRNIIERYQAGLTVREFGTAATPELLELVRQGDGRARASALVLLADLEDPKAVPALREIVRKQSTGGARNSDEKTLAALLGILARARDEASLAIFREGLDHEAEAVRAASLVGLRRLQAMDTLPVLLERLDREPGLVGRELERTVTALCQSDPAAFAERLDGVPPAVRFRVVELLGRAQSAAASQSLRELTDDPDQRVALGAAHMLAKQGDSSGRAVARRIAEHGANAELQRLANEILRILE